MPKLAKKDFAIIGGGRIGRAIARGLISGKVCSARKLIIADPEEGARTTCKRLKCIVTDDTRVAAGLATSIILAVKPQLAETVTLTFKKEAKRKRVISVLAGVTRKKLQTLLPGSRIIRVMPNTPLMVGSGAVAVASEGLTPMTKKWVKQIFSASGKVWFLPEDKLNAVTALSGSGPAVFSYMLESYVRAAIKAGVPEDEAKGLGIQTFIGTGKLLSQTGISPSRLMDMVTSPGGTTEAALNILKKEKLDAITKKAVAAATKRGVELGNPKKKKRGK
jgi:pyrroline-5-carboxylate reductase